MPGLAAAPTQSQAEIARLSLALQQALNDPSDTALEALLASPDSQASLLERRRAFLKRFPEARWQVTPGGALADGRDSLKVSVRGTREDGPIRYRMQASQRLAIRSQGGRLLEQEVIEEQSLMRSGDTPPPVSVRIPDAVLTGSRYDVDVVFETPLDGALVAGGLVTLTDAQWQQQDQPEIQLGPLGGGGLFKSVRAPLTEGHQNWAALLVHPEGIVTVGKRVRVVDQRDRLEL
ncbi:hypothetical protein EVJ50_11815 [Synechococcus sp. RSCCF101]|nr:hypothetical protein EVJ50_11815 [Synechococcus sp. RSCCF101]